MHFYPTIKSYLIITLLSICALVRGQAQAPQLGVGTATQGIFKYHVYFGPLQRKEIVYKYSKDIDGNRISPEAPVTKNDLVFSGGKMNVTSTGDTLFLNLWLQPSSPADRANPTHERVTGNGANYSGGYYDINNEYTYYMVLYNRQWVSFNYADFEVSAITAPLKFRFNYTFKQGPVYVPTELTPQANINVCFQERIGKARYYYDKYAGMTSKSVVSGVIGGFLGMGALSLTATNTKTRALTSDTLGFVASSSGVAVPSFSFGISGGVNFYGFEIGALLGYEVPLQWRWIWDYRRTPFIGFGVGYGIGFVK